MRPAAAVCVDDDEGGVHLQAAVATYPEAILEILKPFWDGFAALATRPARYYLGCVRNSRNSACRPSAWRRSSIMQSIRTYLLPCLLSARWLRHCRSWQPLRSRSYGRFPGRSSDVGSFRPGARAFWIGRSPHQLDRQSDASPAPIPRQDGSRVATARQCAQPTQMAASGAVS